MLLPSFNADRSFTLSLACDPCVESENGSDFERLRALYIATGEPGDLVFPDDATWVEIAPLTPDQEDAAARLAGPSSALGDTVAQRMDEIETEAEIEKPGSGRFVAAEWLDSQPIRYREALHAREKRTERIMLERVCLALRMVSGWTPEAIGGNVETVEHLASLKPVDFYRSVIDSLGLLRISFVVEVFAHLARIGQLSAMGKARSGLRYGSRETHQGAAGPAQTASETPTQCALGVSATAR